MPRKQNPTAKGSRVLWNSLVGTSTESLTLSAYHAQHLIGTYGIRPELAATLVAITFGGQVMPNQCPDIRGAMVVNGTTRAAIEVITLCVPRFSEPRAITLAEPTKAHRCNSSGKGSAVFSLTEKGRTAL